MSKNENTYTYDDNIELSSDIILDTLDTLSNKYNVNDVVIMAGMIKHFSLKHKNIGRLLNYVIDIASDEYVNEELHKNYPEILHFLDLANTNNYTVKFMAYVDTHKEIIKCKKCGVSLDGDCPLLQCPDCGREYIVDIENISKPMCEDCISGNLKTCSTVNKNTAFKIFAIDNRKILEKK